MIIWISGSIVCVSDACVTTGFCEVLDGGVTVEVGVAWGVQALNPDANSRMKNSKNLIVWLRCVVVTIPPDL
jgi:hypothetical protein